MFGGILGGSLVDRAVESLKVRLQEVVPDKCVT